MKKTILSAICAIVLSVANATTITVSNNPNSPGQYTNPQTAIDAPTTQSGDTILVAGSSTHYGHVTVTNKAVHIVGIGYKPDKQRPLKASLTITFSTGSDGSSLQGVHCYTTSSAPSMYIGSSNGFVPVNNITIKRCRITHNIELRKNISNIYIYNNIMSGIGNSSFPLDNIGYFEISNNIINGSINYTTSSSTQSQQPLIIKNNILLTSLNSVENAYFYNNIFYGSVLYGSSTGSCNFNNNLSYSSSGGNNTFPTTGNNGGGNNLEGQNPLFINAPNIYFNYTYNYHTQSGSPVHNAGTDGTDIGIYGGAYPWPDGGVSLSGFMYSQEPQIPQVNQMNITTTTIPVGGNISVTAKGITNP